MFKCSVFNNNTNRVLGSQGILLVNLGTPLSPSTKHVRSYLKEFLMDERVVDVNPVLRTLLVKGLIVPFRSKSSARLYEQIWTKDGSPLLHYSKLQKYKLQNSLGSGYHVELAMRYQNPSIPNALNKLKEAGVESIKVISLFPQYASASSGSVKQKVMEVVSKWQTIPNISFVNSFYDNDKMIEVFANHGQIHNPGLYDHVLFSFHGLPQRQLLKADDTQKHCLKTAGCCLKITAANKFCYSAQSHNTAKLIAGKLKIPNEKYTVCFQSRLGTAPWLTPYTSDTIKQLAREGKKGLLVFCPAFVADCLETIHEIGVEYREMFLQHGGEELQLVESLNDDPLWISALHEIACQ